MRGWVLVACLVLGSAAAEAREPVRFGRDHVERPRLTESEPLAFGVDAARRLYLAGRADASTTFVTQLDPSGHTALSTTYLDDLATDAPLAMAVAPSGEVVLAGSHAGRAMIVRLAADGRSTLFRSTVSELGDSVALAVALDKERNAWVVGRRAGAGAFLAMVDRDGATQVLLSLPADEARALALDAHDDVYVTGTKNGDAWVARVDGRTLEVVFSITFGGRDADAGVALAVTRSGDVVVAGDTRSDDLPIVRGAQGIAGGEGDSFVARFDAASGSLLFSTYAGGPAKDQVRALALDRRDRVWIAGARGADAFAARIEPERTELLAGAAEDFATGVLLDGNGDAWVAGLTASAEVPGASLPESTRTGDAFLAHLPADADAPQGVCPGTKNFTGAVSLAWQTAGNWSGGTLPTTTDDVCISGFNVTMTSGTASVNSLHVQNGSLSVSGGTLTLAAASEVDGPLTVTGTGTVNGAGSLTVSGTLTLSGGTVSGTGTLVTSGATTLGGNDNVAILRNWTVNAPVTWTGGAAVSASSATIQNNSTWDCQGSASMSISVFQNAGTVKKSAGAGVTEFHGTLNNTGTVLAQVGTLVLGGGTSTGSFDASAGAIIQFGIAAAFLNAGATFTGSGTIEVAVTGAFFPNVPITFPATLTFHLNGFSLSPGASGSLTTAGTFRWSRGTIQALSGPVTSNGPFNVVPGATKTLQGTLNLNAGAVLTDSLTLSNAGVLTNNGGILDLQTDASLSQGVGSPSTVNNTGTLKKSGGTGVSTISATLNNSGSLLVQSGTVTIGGPASSSGTLGVSAGAILQLGASGLTLNAGTAFSGAGTVRINAGTLTVASTAAMPAPMALELTGGVLQGAGTLTVGGPVTWSGGTLTGAGSLTCNGDLSITGAASKPFSQRILNTNGTTTFTASSLSPGSGATINNAGTWEHQSDGGINWTGQGSTSNFNNSGTFRRNVGTGAVTLMLPFNNSGTVEVQTGTLQVSGQPYTQTAGATRLAGGRFESYTSTSLQGGTLSGAGAMLAGGSGVVVSGTGSLSPGLTAGTAGAIDLDGSYVQQAPNGTFQVELGGTTPGTYDRLNAGLAATLAGNLVVSLVNGYVPNIGDSFTLLTYTSRTGTFTTTTFPAVPCIDWQLSYGATALVLTAVAGSPPAEIAQVTAPTKSTLSWAAGPAGVTYDVLRGSLSTLPVGPGTGETCVASNLAATSITTATPAPGTGAWYVVRGRAAGCGPGSYGSASSGAERISTGCP